MKVHQLRRQEEGKGGGKKKREKKRKSRDLFNLRSDHVRSLAARRSMRTNQNALEYTRAQGKKGGRKNRKKGKKKKNAPFEAYVRCHSLGSDLTSPPRPQIKAETKKERRRREKKGPFRRSPMPVTSLRPRRAARRRPTTGRKGGGREARAHFQSLLSPSMRSAYALWPTGAEGDK